MQETLTFQESLVFDYFLCAAAHSDKGCHDDSHKEITDQILVVHHTIAFRRCVTCKERTDQCQQRCLQQGNTKVLDIRNLGLDVTVKEYHELLQGTRFLLV